MNKTNKPKQEKNTNLVLKSLTGRRNVDCQELARAGDVVMEELQFIALRLGKTMNMDKKYLWHDVHGETLPSLKNVDKVSRHWMRAERILSNGNGQPASFLKAAQKLNNCEFNSEKSVSADIVAAQLKAFRDCYEDFRILRQMTRVLSKHGF